MAEPGTCLAGDGSALEEARRLLREREQELDDLRKAMAAQHSALDRLEQERLILQAGQERYRRIVETANEGIWWLDGQGCTLYANARMRELLALTPQEMTMASLAEHLFFEDDPTHGTLWDLLDEGDGVASAEMRLAERDGMIRWVLVKASRVHENDESAGLLLMITDVTEQNLARSALEETHADLEWRVETRTQELASKASELERSNAELEQFAYVASHDLQEPLRMISSYSQLLARRYKGQLDEKADRWIDYAVEGANRMQKLISDLLAYSRVGSKVFEPVEVSLAEPFRAALHNLLARVAETKARVTWDPLPTVKVDSTQMTQVFQNLLSNAVKFRGQERPHVQVSAHLQGSEWLISVRDNGIGISPDYWDRIFVIFQRLHRRTEYDGTGIGLAICRKIVERHGGRIWVESVPGQGSTFFFTLRA